MRQDTVITIETVLQKVTDLRPLPIASEVLTLLREEDPSVDVRRVLSADPALAAKVLRVANSPFYGMRSRISTIDQAVLVIGTRATLSIIVAVATFSSVRSSKSTPESLEGRVTFLRHAVGCGITARLLADGRRCNPEEAFLAGLLHDIGWLALLEFYPDVLVRLPGDAYTDFDDPLGEREILGFDHQDIGAGLLEHWRLPAAIVHALRRHHQPLEADGTADSGALLNLLYIADRLSPLAEKEAAEGQLILQFVRSDVAKTLAVTDSEIATVKRQLPGLLAETLAILKGADL